MHKNLFVFVFMLIGLPLAMFAETPIDPQISSSLQKLRSASRSNFNPLFRSGKLRSIHNLRFQATSANPETSARQFLDQYRDLFGMNDPEIDLRLKRIQNSITATHVRFHQFYRNVKIYGAEISAHINHNGKIRTIHTNAFPTSESKSTHRSRPVRQSKLL